MAKLTIGDKTITIDDGFKALPAEQQQAVVEHIASQLGLHSDQPKQEMVGFGERGQREQDMPETPELRHDINVAKRMAGYRDQIGPGAMLQEGFALGLGDEAKAAGAAVGGMLRGNNPVDTYNEDVEARRKIKQEYRDKSTLGTAAEITGNLLAGAPRAGYQAATTLLGTMGEGALAAGSLGAIQGFGEGEGLKDSVIGAGVGGAVGGALGGALPGVLHGIGAATTGVRNAFRAARNPEEEGLRRVGQVAEQARANGSYMDDAEFNRLRNDGAPLVVGDRGGEAMHRLARSAADQSVEAGQILDNALTPRAAAEQDRLDTFLSGLSRRGGNPEQHIADAEVASRQANQGLYGRAFDLGADSVWDDTLEGLAQTPAMQRALRRAVENWRNKAPGDPWMRNQRMFNPPVGVDEVGDIVFRNRNGLPAYPNLRLWDLAKQELDDMASAAGRSGERGAARDLGEIARQLRNHLDSMGEMGQAYQAARRSAAEMFGANNAYEAGLSFQRSNSVTAREALRGWQRLAPQERELFREGYIQALRDKLAEIKTNREAARNFMASPADRAKARIVLGRQEAERFQNMVNVEGRMNALRQEVRGGSRTNRYQLDRGLAGATGLGAVGGGYLGSGDTSSVSIGALAGAASRHGQRVISERLSRQIAQILVSGDMRRVEAIMRAAQRSPQLQAAIQSAQKSLAGRLGATVASAASGP
jgi:hypothetical protein